MSGSFARVSDMDWLSELFRGTSIANTILIVSLVAAGGVFLGSFKIRGIGLGVAGVLFSGLLFGHLGFKVDAHVREFIREFGLILFVYTIGVQVGPGFIASLKRQGLPLNLMAFAIVILGVGLTLAVSFLGKIDMSVAVGLFSGATTNTPSLGAAQQALNDVIASNADLAEDLATNPSLGYAVAYPFGVLGIILAMGLVRALFRIDPQNEAREFSRHIESNAPLVTTMNIVVENGNLNGLKIREVPGLRESGVIVSRVFKGGEVAVATPDTVLHVGDVLLAVGPEEKVRQMRIVIGSATDVDLKRLPGNVTTRRVVVTKQGVLGKTLDELNLMGVYGVAVTRISRADIEFTPTPSFTFQYADTVLLVGPADAIDRGGRALGDQPKQLSHPQIVPIFVGIALGVILGSWPFHLPTIPAPVKLGLAGGPLLVAIFLSRLGRVGPLIYYMPLSANFMLREMGIVLFLACVGLKAGDQFLETLTKGDGLYWMACAAAITLLPLLIVGFAARAFFKVNFTSLCGVLSGSMTDPPALAFANSIAGSDAPSISYATVYPLTMLLRVVAAQVLVLVFIR